MCETGGSLQNKPGTQFGFQSRALKAAYFLKKAGYTKVGAASTLPPPRWRQSMGHRLHPCRLTPTTEA